MSEERMSKGRGRHGPRPPDKRYDGEKARAIARFEQQAMPLAVAAELGVPYRTVWGWRQKWLLAKAAA